MTKKIGVTETILRDAHQSLIATRMRGEDMFPVARLLDQVGYHSLEMWGGATFDSAMRFLGEDPWERLRKLKQAIRRTPLQMLLRGQNILGYKHYPDDVVVEFVKRSVGNGIDVVRIFDALNDLRNLEVAVKATKQAGGHAQIAVSYTISPVHNTDYYVRLAGDIVSMGADSICIKDMAGLLSPFDAYDLVSQLKKAYPDLSLQMHTHYTSGMGSMTYLKSVEAGADVIDTAISPYALGTSQPATETMVAVLRDTPYDTGLDLEALDEIATYFKKIKPKYSDLEKTSFIDTNVLKYQIPGGMLSNLMSQLEEQKAADKFAELLLEVPRVREDLGYPPLVTPTSQIVGTQAVFNVVTGERYKVVPVEVRNYLKGMYGRAPGPIDEDFRRRIIGGGEVLSGRAADSLPPGLEKGQAELGATAKSMEDVLSYILFPQVALEFFRQRALAATSPGQVQEQASQKPQVKKRFGQDTYLFGHWGQEC